MKTLRENQKNSLKTQAALGLGLLLFLNIACEVQMDADGKVVVREIYEGDARNLRIEEDPDKLVCDPLGGNGGGQGYRNGIKGEIFYIPEYARTTSNVNDLLDNSLKIQASLYMNDINVPTRPFDQGFEMSNGNTIKTPEGDTLYEYFGLKLDAHLQLGNLEPGYYQFAILSDDGSVLELDLDDNGFKPFIDNNGLHPTRMGCASRTVYMDGSTKIPMHLEYYQGPRYHISVMLLARKVEEHNRENAAFLDDPACNTAGNSRFFDSTKPNSPPQPTYLAMQGRGWSPLTADNYVLPEDVRQNPCKDIIPPVRTGGGDKKCTGFSCGNGGIGI